MSKSKAPTPTSAPQTTEEAVSPRTSVILPTHNEEENISQLLGELEETFQLPRMEAFSPHEIIFVDGGSNDGTREIIRQAAASRSAIHAVFLKRRFGQSAALAAGFDAAQGEFIVPMDADLQNDPRDIPPLLEKLDDDRLDCVSGWRKDRNDPWHKTIPSAIQTRLAKFTGPDINDFGCTLTAYRREALDDISLYGEGHRYIPAKLYDKGYSIGEIEVNHRPRKHGNSRYGAGRLVRGFVDLVFHWFWVHYSTRPLHVFAPLGFTLMAAGGLLGGASIIQRYLFGVPLDPRTPRLVLVGLLVLFGLQLLVFGVLAEMLTKLHYSDDREYRIEKVVK